MTDPFCRKIQRRKYIGIETWKLWQRDTEETLAQEVIAFYPWVYGGAITLKRQHLTKSTAQSTQQKKEQHPPKRTPKRPSAPILFLNPSLEPIR